MRAHPAWARRSLPIADLVQWAWRQDARGLGHFYLSPSVSGFLDLCPSAWHNPHVLMEFGVCGMLLTADRWL